MESAKAAAEPDFKDVEVEFPIESPSSKRPKLDGPYTTTITTESTDVKGSHKAEVKPIIPHWVHRFVENCPEDLMAGYFDIPSHWRCPICNRAGHNDVTCPERPRYVRLWCFECLGTCQRVDDHSSYAYIKRLMECTVCRVFGKHWINECPNLETYGNDIEYGDIEHGDDFGDSSLETDDSDDSEGF